MKASGTRSIATTRPVPFPGQSKCAPKVQYSRGLYLSKSCYAVEQVPLLGNQEDTQRIGLVVRTQRIILLAVA